MSVSPLNLHLCCHNTNPFCLWRQFPTLVPTAGALINQNSGFWCRSLLHASHCGLTQCTEIHCRVLQLWSWEDKWWIWLASGNSMSSYLLQHLACYKSPGEWGRSSPHCCVACTRIDHKLYHQCHMCNPGSQFLSPALTLVVGLELLSGQYWILEEKIDRSRL